jgi:tRNA G26 N,N-dimethylase Trm1
MAKVKNYYMDKAEEAVDVIIKNLKNNVITKSVAIKEIMNVEAVDLIDIDEYNVEEVIDMELETA